MDGPTADDETLERAMRAVKQAIPRATTIEKEPSRADLVDHWRQLHYEAGYRDGRDDPVRSAIFRAVEDEAARIQREPLDAAARRPRRPRREPHVLPLIANVTIPEPDGSKHRIAMSEALREAQQASPFDSTTSAQLRGDRFWWSLRKAGYKLRPSQGQKLYGELCARMGCRP